MTVLDEPIFSEREARAFAPPERISCWEWICKHAVIPENKPHAGRYDPSVAPFMGKIVDCLDDPDIEIIAVKKSAQAGFTTALTYALGRSLAAKRESAILVYPSKDKALEALREEIKEAMKATPTWSACHVGGTEKRLDFEGASVYGASARSPSDLARRSLPLAICDECNKYPHRSVNDEGDPISLVLARVRAWGSRGKLLIGSTPTTRAGYITRYYEQAEGIKEWRVQCPHCHEYQAWSFQQLKCTKTPHENPAIEAASVKDVHYLCVHCGGRIEEHQRRKMDATGQWFWKAKHAEKPKTVAFHVWAMMSPIVKWRKLIRQAILSKGDALKTQEFVNQWLGVEFESIVKSFETKLSAEERAKLPAYGVVPIWANVLIASVDVQKRGDAFEFIWLLRAWGHGGKSQLVAWGRAPSEQHLLTVVRGSYPIDQTKLRMPVSSVWIDSGFEATTIYAIAAKYGWQPLKGASRLDAPIYRDNTKTPIPGQRLVILNTGIFKDRIANAQKSRKWTLNAGPAPEQLDEYLSHLAAERMIEDVKRHKRYWVEVKAGAPNHYLDCEVYNFAAATIMGVELLPEPNRQAGAESAPQAAQQRQSFAVSGLYD